MEKFTTHELDAVYFVSRLQEILDNMEMNFEKNDEIAYRCGIKDHSKFRSYKLEGEIPWFFWRKLTCENAKEARREGYKFFSEKYGATTSEDVDKYVKELL